MRIFGWKTPKGVKYELIYSKSFPNKYIFHLVETNELIITRSVR